MNKKVDILVFGAHPDDIELGVGGIIAASVRSGHKVGLVDLTRGELGTGGDMKQREQEAKKAAHILNVSNRTNLCLPDRGIEINSSSKLAIIKLIRLAQPQLILAPYYKDRHPDHVKTSELVKNAIFDSGLKKICPQIPVYKPKMLAYYFLNYDDTPSLIVDVTDFYNIKIEAIDAHQSQFSNGNNSMKDLIVNRDRYYGSQINTGYGEGLYLPTPLSVTDVLTIWSGII
ncbi:MAG: bacillithiol biosynthesis deacetylase BshB1 [Firmicutes bacterium]|nr:bacillithiol biosynthesis deacetylase BshB1 [Bacillota bacterium]